MKFDIVLVTCDKTQWILPIVFYFFEKYLPKDYPVTILGFNKPDIEFPENITFHSMGTSQKINQWSMDIYNFTKTLKKEYIMFLLDDFFLLDNLRVDKLENLIEKMDQDSNIGLCNIGYAPQYVPNVDTLLVDEEDYFLCEQHSPLYQINCQPSIYRRSHFNQYFQKPQSPWKLELNRNHRNIQKRLLCCSPLNKKGTLHNTTKTQSPIYKTQLCSALSKTFSGINMQNAKPEDINALVEKKLLKKDEIIYK